MNSLSILITVLAMFSASCALSSSNVIVDIEPASPWSIGSESVEVDLTSLSGDHNQCAGALVERRGEDVYVTPVRSYTVAEHGEMESLYSVFAPTEWNAFGPSLAIPISRLEPGERVKIWFKREDGFALFWQYQLAAQQALAADAAPPRR